MIFPKIECDLVAQTNDKVRIGATKSYVPKGSDPITKVEIEPYAGAGFIDVSGASPLNSKNWWLDWEYDTDGDKVVSVKVTTTVLGPVTETVSHTITVLSAADDKLLSDDQDLVAIESDILKYIPEGRSSFKYVHREAQKEILEWLYTNGYKQASGDRFTIDHIINIEDFKYWSKYLVLRLLYTDFSKAPDDVFMVRAKRYENDEHKWRMKAALKIDINSDGTQDSLESFDMTTRSFIRE